MSSDAAVDTVAARCTSAGEHAGATSPVFFVGVGELLGEGRASAERGSFPVHDVDGDDEDERNAGEDGRGVFKVLAAAGADVTEERCGGNGQDTGKEVARPAVATRRGGRVRSVRANHVVCVES